MEINQINLISLEMPRIDSYMKLKQLWLIFPVSNALEIAANKREK